MVSDGLVPRGNCHYSLKHANPPPSLREGLGEGVAPPCHGVTVPASIVDDSPSLAGGDCAFSETIIKQGVPHQKSSNDVKL